MKKNKEELITKKTIIKWKAPERNVLGTDFYQMINRKKFLFAKGTPIPVLTEIFKTLLNFDYKQVKVTIEIISPKNLPKKSNKKGAKK